MNILPRTRFNAVFVFYFFIFLEIVTFNMELWNRSLTLFLLDRVDCDVTSRSTSHDSHI